MSRLTALAGACLVVAGCNDPGPPPEPQQLPDLTTELAKRALLEMLSDPPDLLRGVPIDPTQLAIESVVVYESGLWSVGNITINPAKAAWQFQESGRRGCYWMAEGKFELVGERWVAKPSGVALANPGPGKD